MPEGERESRRMVPGKMRRRVKSRLQPRHSLPLLSFSPSPIKRRAIRRKRMDLGVERQRAKKKENISRGNDSLASLWSRRHKEALRSRRRREKGRRNNLVNVYESRFYCCSDDGLMTDLPRQKRSSRWFSISPG